MSPAQAPSVEVRQIAEGGWYRGRIDLSSLGREVVLIPEEVVAATMTIADPLSLTEAKRLATGVDTVLLRATRDADLETPIGAFLRLDDGGPAYLLESVEGGERLGRYSFLGIGPRRLLEVRGGHASVQSRPLSVDRFDAGPADRDPRLGRPAEHPPGNSCRSDGSGPSRACPASPAERSAPSPMTR